MHSHSPCSFVYIQLIWNVDFCHFLLIEDWTTFAINVDLIKRCKYVLYAMVCEQRVGVKDAAVCVQNSNRVLLGSLVFLYFTPIRYFLYLQSDKCLGWVVHRCIKLLSWYSSSAQVFSWYHPMIAMVILFSPLWNSVMSHGQMMLLQQTWHHPTLALWGGEAKQVTNIWYVQLISRFLFGTSKYGIDWIQPILKAIYIQYNLMHVRSLFFKT